mmetsp:Transcript_5437/g.7345  ORF Transcript_5437/g.7345 Transcript_5437/m.7345 type:complete len:281 (-) Transcript_5437:89-931(-)
MICASRSEMTYDKLPSTARKKDQGKFNTIRTYFKICMILIFLFILSGVILKMKKLFIPVYWQGESDTRLHIAQEVDDKVPIQKQEENQNFEGTGDEAVLEMQQEDFSFEDVDDNTTIQEQQEDLSVEDDNELKCCATNWERLPSSVSLAECVNYCHATEGCTGILQYYEVYFFSEHPCTYCVQEELCSPRAGALPIPGKFFIYRIPPKNASESVAAAGDVIKETREDGVKDIQNTSFISKVVPRNVPNGVQKTKPSKHATSKALTKVAPRAKPNGVAKAI